ncbi:MAG: hypothetical protein IPL32_10570 [Chloracidobacterium sp.]|nr:hypothetical protein [Chloracidobacterium sp.]
MKTIFRYTNIAVLLAAFIVLGTVASFAQDPCADAEGQTTLGDKFRAEFADKSIEGRKKAIETGKQFLEKYGSCDSAKDLGDYFKGQLPKMEAGLKVLQDQKAKDDLTNPFDAALKAKDWDKVYSFGKQILEKYPDEYRPVEIVLGSIGGEEAVTKANFKYADDALVFAKQSIADLEAGKTFVLANKPAFGFSFFSYPNKDDAIGWLNYYIGFITNVVKKDKEGALPYLYKATQAASESKTKAVPYSFIGYYYAAQGDKLADEIQALIKAQDAKDTEEVAKQKVEVIKARVALFNGTNERAADAFARAISRAPDAAYKAEIKKALEFSYNRRFGKMDGFDAWVANAQKQPFANPTTPVTPISDPEPTAPAATSTAPTAPEVKPSAPATKPPAVPAKPATTTPAKPAATTKPQAKTKKGVVKKKNV